MDKLIELSRRLGRQIAAHERTVLMQNAQKALQEDPDARKLVEDFQKQAEKIHKLEQENKPIEVADKHQLEAYENQMSSNDKVREFSRRQADYVEMMRKIWDAIHNEIIGEQEPAE
ncbi:MAG: YlbF family regulator [Sedimentisphaerales bacterium]|nr:YlbF family regulator [Sedimentisphaerales bacterium]